MKNVEETDHFSRVFEINMTDSLLPRSVSTPSLATLSRIIPAGITHS